MQRLRSAHLAPESHKNGLNGRMVFQFARWKNVTSEVNLPRQGFDDVFIPNGYVDILKWKHIVDGSLG